MKRIAIPFRLGTEPRKNHYCSGIFLCPTSERLAAAHEKKSQHMNNTREACACARVRASTSSDWRGHTPHLAAVVARSCRESERHYYFVRKPTSHPPSTLPDRKPCSDMRLAANSPALRRATVSGGRRSADAGPAADAAGSGGATVVDLGGLACERGGKVGAERTEKTEKSAEIFFD